MPLTPLDIHNKEFHKGLRGYVEAEVDEFLDQVVRDYEALIKENSHLKEQVESLTAQLEHYRHLESTLQNTLIVAQETAEEVKTSARKEADLIVREAQLEADRLIKAAEARIGDLQDAAEQLRKQLQIFRAKVRSMLESQLALLDADWGLEEPDPPSWPPPAGAAQTPAAGETAAAGDPLDD